MKLTLDGLTLGVWLWGIFTVLLGGSVLAVLFGEALTASTGAAYRVVKENGGVLGPMITASGLIWSWFFQMHQQRRRAKDET